MNHVMGQKEKQAQATVVSVVAVHIVAAHSRNGVYCRSKPRRRFAIAMSTYTR